MSGHHMLPGVLRALAGHDPGVRPGDATDEDRDWLVRSGLGPVIWRLVQRNQLEVPGRWRETLQASDLIARLEMQKLIRITEEVVGRVRRRGADVTLLKGISVATRYYADPHLRVMGDVDLLIPREAIDDAAQELRGEGYRLSTFAAPEWWDTHHHAPPLIHPVLDVTVELHHAMLPPDTPPARDPPFDVATLGHRTVASRLGSEPVRRLRPECELALLAAAWANDLSTFLGDPGLQRPLVDAVVLLERTRDTFDWQQLLRWTDGSATGVYLWLLISVLARHRALPCDDGVLEQARAGVRGIGRASARMIHHRVDRHVVRHEPFGRILTGNNTATLLRTLLGNGPALRRFLAVPFNVAFPPSNDRRFHIGFQVERIRSLLRVR